ncbi:hypothetical protein L6164_035547 [Bauhinia variegata]|uniref:Uncharacterized protein n=1 Tax=Bauhinia variegata TaxID=167791 RepID=A0ACB9KEG1_BAUVA|nr:hypothetical protein L6164_035547 [Bauhinia variegata]
MATIETNTKSSLHIRCNSLPSAPHPLVSQFEEHLDRLKSSEATSSSSLSSSTISHNLGSLQDLHDCIDKLLQLPITPISGLARDCCDELLDGSLRLLDICTTATDALLESKESIHELQSFVRRRRGGEISLPIGGEKYLASRKKLKKAIHEGLRNLKGIKNELISSSSKNDKENFSLLSILKEAEAVTLSSLKSLLMFVSDPKGQSKQSRWSMISTLKQTKRVACDSQVSDTNEFNKVDAALQSNISHKSSSVENLQNHMENLEICIQVLEVGIEHLLRQLIKTRVSLLNIFNY